MWPFKKKILTPEEEPERMPYATAAAIIIAVIALALAAGVCRWSWLLMDEQIQLRKDFMQLKNSQDQSNIQYEFWSKEIQKERAQLKDLAPQAPPAPKK